MTEKAKKQGRPAKTLKQRAEEMGISQKTLQNRINAGGGKDPEVVDALKQAQIRKTNLDADKIEMSMEVVAGSLYPRDKVDEMVQKIGYVTNALLRATSSELPPLVAGLSPAKAEKVIREWSIAWSDKLKGAEDEVWVEARKSVVRETRGDLKKVAAAKARKGE